MIGLDTNVIVRFLTQDDEKQSKTATELIETKISVESPGYVTCITLVEVFWVLKSCYGLDKTQLSQVVRMLLETRQLVIEKSDCCYRALRVYESSQGDFSDALIATLSKYSGCTDVFTFDKKAQTVGMTLLA